MEKPILFSTPMVEAIFDGRKTQTRRVVKFKKNIEVDSIGWSTFTPDNHFSVRGTHENGKYGESFFKQPIEIGDVLWVREKWCLETPYGPEDYYYGYACNNFPFIKADEKYNFETPNKWKPSIFMPKDACRLYLKVTNVRIQLLNKITEEDAIAEGVQPIKAHNRVHRTIGYNNYLIDPKNGFEILSTAKESFETLWQSINGKKSWKENTWVFVYDFEIKE